MTDLIKPLKRSVLSNVPYVVNPKIIITLYPNGIIGLRESRRRREYTLGFGSLYVQAVAQQARKERIAKKKARKARRQSLGL